MFIALAVATGCGGHSSDALPAVTTSPEAGAPPVAPDASSDTKVSAFAAAAARALCSGHAQCCESTGRNFSQETCLLSAEASMALRFDLSKATPGVEIPARCLDELALFARECRDWQEWRPCPELDEATHARAVEGEQCKGTCYRWNGSLVCGYVSNIFATAECFVKDGLHCGPASRRCEPLGALGAPCSSGITCASGSCDPESGTCIASVPEGADCTNRPTICGGDFLCMAGPDYCAPDITWLGPKCVCTRTKPEGAPCGGSDCSVGSCINGRCESARRLSDGEIDEMCRLSK
jgi:hypothetical protein